MEGYLAAIPSCYSPCIWALGKHPFCSALLSWCWRSVSLEEIGHLDEFRAFVKEGILKRFQRQVCDAAANAADGPLMWDFTNSYDFTSIEYSHGDGVISGVFEGKVEWVSQYTRWFSGIVNLAFTDTVTDVYNYLEEVYGSSNPPGLTLEELRRANIGGTAYKISGEWQERMEGAANRCEVYG